MMPLRVALVQSILHWEQPEANRKHFEQVIQKIDQEVDIVVLPEMFTTGFTMNTSLAEPMNGPTLNWIQQIAQTHNHCIVGSLMIAENGLFYNRLIFVFQDGTYAYYDKRHLFSLANEQLHFAAGTAQKIVTCNGWKIALNICYDLRFPVWLRRTPNFSYDILLLVANWPQKRVGHWKALLQARAIENQSYVLGVNRVGIDGNDFIYSGDSGVISPQGIWLNQPDDVDKVIYTTLNSNELNAWRDAFPAANDADSFSLA